MDTSTNTPRKRREQGSALAAALAITTAGILPGLLVGTMAVRIQSELHISNTIFGLALAGFFGTGGILAIPGGRLADRIGWRRSVRLAAGSSIACLFGIAVLGRSTSGLVIPLVLGGTTLAVAGPAGNLALTREMPDHRLGLVFGIKQAALPLATAFAGLSLPVVALTVGWRWAFAAATVFPLTAIVAARSSGDGTADAIAPKPIMQVAPNRSLVTFSVACAMANTGAGAIAAFLVASSVALGMAEATAGLVYAFASGIGLVTRVYGGWLADRYRARGFRAVTVMMAVGAAGFALLASRSVALIVPGAILAFAGGWSWAGLLLYGVVRQHPDRPATATGAITVGTASGIALGPLLFGFLVDHAGYRVAWLAAGAALVAGAWLVRVGERATVTTEPELPTAIPY